MSLYTNQSTKKDFIKNAIIESALPDTDIFIATAFFTESTVINDLIDKNCHVRIVVRLGYPTSPKALEQLLGCKNVEARFYTSTSFHPKMYIFGNKSVLIGSANLTTSALLTNQEVMVGIDSEDSRFSDLLDLFSGYWNEAEVLNQAAINQYRKIFSKFQQISNMVKSMDDEVSEAMGDTAYSNVSRGKKETNRKSIFLDTYRKTYQESVSAFRRIEEIYKLFNRKVSNGSIPLRLEIDSFFSFVRDKHATQDVWKQQSIGWDQAHRENLKLLIKKWLETPADHFENEIVPTNYPLIQRVLGSKSSILNSNMDEITEALCVLHSFYDRFRFYKGGISTLKSTFIAKNTEQHVKQTLVYLIHGHGDMVERMADCIYESRYKLKAFGQANVQELVGWVNREELPVVNGRTTKILRYFGNDVQQLGES